MGCGDLCLWRLEVLAPSGAEVAGDRGPPDVGAVHQLRPLVCTPNHRTISSSPSLRIKILLLHSSAVNAVIFIRLSLEKVKIEGGELAEWTEL